MPGLDLNGNRLGPLALPSLGDLISAISLLQNDTSFDLQSWLGKQFQRPPLTFHITTGLRQGKRYKRLCWLPSLSISSTILQNGDITGWVHELSGPLWTRLKTPFSTWPYMFFFNRHLISQYTVVPQHPVSTRILSQ